MTSSLSRLLSIGGLLVSFIALVAAWQVAFAPFFSVRAVQPAQAAPDTPPLRPALVLNSPDIKGSQADIGETIVFPVTIENQGQGAAHNLVLYADGEEFFTDASTALDELGAGETHTFSLPLTVTGRSAEGGFILLLPAGR